MKAALLGHGTVGSGVAEILLNSAEKVAADAGRPIELRYILDLREFPDLPYADRFVKDFSVIENDPEISLVIEAIGGLSPAYDFVKRALENGKSVITSNKELIAEKGAELFKIAEKKDVNLFYEAAVGGTIPVIRALATSFGGAEIKRIAGILNGTTNYILTAMKKDGVSYETALAEAQRLGYAEADPTTDVSGLDCCRKITILASLAWGKNVAPERIAVAGISSVSIEDIELAEKLGYCVKLIGRAEKSENGLSVSVSPMLIPKGNLLSSVDDVFNAVLISTKTNGDTVFYGRGAGKFPTAAAVVADVIEAAKSGKTRKEFIWSTVSENCLTLAKNRYFMRFSGAFDEAFSSCIESFVPSHEHCAFSRPLFEHEVAELEKDVFELGGKLTKIPLFE